MKNFLLVPDHDIDLSNYLLTIKQNVKIFQTFSKVPKFLWNYQTFYCFPTLGLVFISITVIINYWNFRNYLEITEISTFFTSLGLVSLHILLLSMTDISEITKISIVFYPQV